MKKNIIEGGEQSCPMVCLVKDHKGWSYDPGDPAPPSRPVVAGNLGINRCLSEMVSLIIEPITLNMGGHSIESTGDMLHLISELNNSGLIEELISNDPDPAEVNERTDIYNGTHMDETINKSIRARLESLRNSTVRGSNIPDLKERLLASGLIDRIEGKDCPMSLPKRTVNTFNQPKPK